MAAYAGLASLMNNVEQIMDHPRLSASLDIQRIQPLLEVAGSLLEFIEGCNHGGVMSKEVEDLERQITCAAHAAEDVIESHIVEQIHAGSTEVSLSCSLCLQQIVEDMDDILRKANELKEKQGFGEKQHPTYSRRDLMETVMVGFEEELLELKDKLTNQQSSRHVISIVGMGGTGKTTLTQNLYQDSCIKQYFDIRAWATVSQQYDVEGILSQLFSHLGTVSQSGENLHKALYSRRYLIILDDIWSVEAWDKVRHFFPDNGNGSRVVLTTRLSNMARDCSSSCITMKPLDEHISWELFCIKAFGQETCPYPELEKVGKEIARLCRGLPLSTVVIGGLLLNSPRSLPLWKNVVTNIKSAVPGSKEKEESLDILSLSYNHLPPHLKPCFLYMGVFTEDSEIRVSDIINLWIAEGFVRRKNTLGLEEVAEGYLKELMDRNLISISKHRKNGKIGSCGIHDLMRDLCLKVGQQQGFFHLVPKGTFRGSTERRLVYPKTDGVIYSPPALGRSIVAWHVHGWVAARCKLLRVCYTEVNGAFRETNYINVNLRYLSSPLVFKQNEPVWELPSSVSLLWNLQTLAIQENRDSDSVVVAPIEIWKMRQLKHVKCTKIFLPVSDGTLFVMDKLQTLRTAINLRLSEEVCKMIPNIKKLHLLYQGNLHGYDDGFIEFLQNLDCLLKLESLNLSFPRIRQLTTKSELNKKLAFPTSLRKLSLSGCRLGWEDLSMIGSLPELEVLELGISSVMVGSRWSPADEQFPRLKYLKIDWCSLRYWEADNSHFPVLTKLILSGLRQLEEIPGGIGEIPTLELIRVEYCSESAAVLDVRILEDQVELGNDGLQIQVRIFASVLESFKEKVEAEGLKINDIQLEIR